MTEKIEKKWYQYVIFDKSKTYVGSTVNLSRRIRQHNGEIKGGAKYTRGGSWQYYCVVYDINNYKNTCLSDEWHVKHYSVRKVKASKNAFDKRRQAIELWYQTRPRITKPYDYVIFVSSIYSNQYLPMVDNRTLIIIVDNFSTENIEKLLSAIKELVTRLPKENLVTDDETTVDLYDNVNDVIDELSSDDDISILIEC